MQAKASFMTVKNVKVSAVTSADLSSFDFTPQKAVNLASKPFVKPNDLYANKETAAAWFNKLCQDGPGRVTCEFAQLTKSLNNHGLTNRAWLENRAKNRYDDMLCFDHTRVILLDGLKPNYIHANYVHGYNRKNAYILAQGPLDHTVFDMWRLIWQERIATVVMLARLVENGREKCACYFPTTSATDMQIGLFRISLVKFDGRDFCSASLFQVVNLLDHEVRFVAHVWFTTWPDRGVPSDVICLRNFLNYVKVINVNMSISLCAPPLHPRGPPILFHCSAGVGRSAVCVLLDIFTESLNHSDFKNPMEIIVQMRRQRFHAIHTKDQLLFSYEYILHLLKHPRYKLLQE